MKATPKASYGWFCGKTSEATFRQVDKAAAQGGLGDPHLKTLLQGQDLSLLHVGNAGCDGCVATSKEAGGDSWCVARGRMD